MGVEIERKFLVKDSLIFDSYTGKKYIQGYLPSNGLVGTRIRIAGDKGYITIKSAVVGITRAEFEYEIPLADADAMLRTLCNQPLISKVRYKIEYKGFVWEVDVFDGDNKGLILAEVELKSEDEKVDLPDWIEKEVTGKKRFYNARLINYPFCKWTEEEKSGN